MPEGVKAERWRILVGEGPWGFDELLRRSPEQAYDRDFFESFARQVGWRLGPDGSNTRRRRHHKGIKPEFTIE
jgi:hypothetical protein